MTFIDDETEHQKLYKIANILVKHDTEQECRYCSKTEWGQDLHDEDCPFEIAYKILSGKDETKE